MASAAGLIPGGGNYSGTNIALPFAPQQGGQASIGGNINPLLPINTSTSTAYPMYPQGAVSNSATSGFPAVPSFTGNGFTGAPAATNTGGSTFPANTPGGMPGPVVPGGPPGIVAPPNNPGAGQTGITGVSAGAFGFPTTPQGQHQLWSSLNKTYGSGLATTIMNFLAKGAGFNQDAINNLIAGLQPQFNTAKQNLLQQFSAGGSRFGSGGQVGLADLVSQENLEVGELETQMYEQSLQDYINVLMGTAGASATRKENQSSFLDTLLGSGGVGSLGTLFGGVASGLQDLGLAGGGAAAAGGAAGGAGDLAALAFL